jgi:hypothetical protein
MLKLSGSSSLQLISLEYSMLLRIIILNAKEKKCQSVATIYEIYIKFIITYIYIYIYIWLCPYYIYHFIYIYIVATDWHFLSFVFSLKLSCNIISDTYSDFNLIITWVGKPIQFKDNFLGFRKSTCLFLHLFSARIWPTYEYVSQPHILFFIFQLF